MAMLPIAHAGDFPDRDAEIFLPLDATWQLPMPEIFRTRMLHNSMIGHCSCRRFSGHRCCIMAALPIAHAGNFPDIDIA